MHAELAFDDGHGVRGGERWNSVTEVAQLAKKWRGEEVGAAASIIKLEYGSLS